MATLTATVRASKPAVGGDLGPAWPNDLNLGFDQFDRAINQTIVVNIPDTNVLLTADGSNADQAVYRRIQLSGTQSTSRIVTLPNCQRIGYATNLTSGGLPVILTTGVGSSVSIPPNAQFYEYAVDSSGNVFLVGLAAPGNPAAGQLGEYVSATVFRSSPVGVPFGNTPLNVTSISLTAGDWDVSGNVGFLISASATVVQGWISIASASVPTSPGNGAYSIIVGTLGDGTLLPISPLRLNLASTTTVFLEALVSVISGTVSVYGFIGARRSG